MKRVAMRELQRKLPDIIEELSASGEPLVVTQGNDPKAMLVRFGDYDALNQQAVQGHPYISSNPGISRGEPIIRGTRITIQHVVERIQAGQTVEGILLDLQHLTPAQVHDALSYY